MSSMASSIHERQELERITRFLGLKFAQIIVQSRSGETMRTECKAKPCSADWFNLVINDLAEVSTITKYNLQEELLNSAIPLCVEISVKTAEGFNTALEIWSLGVLPERDDPIVRVSNTTAYSRMGALLRSLLMISRVTPAYALSRKQSRDSYIICYRIFMAEPRLHVLGDNHKHIRVGKVRTPMGTIHLTMSYRTRMTFSTTRKDSPEALLMKSDHFQADSSPEHRRNEFKVGAFVVARRMPVKRDGLFFDVPFSALLSPPRRVTAAQPANASASDASKQSPGEAAAEPKSPDEESRSDSSIISAKDEFVMVDLKSPFVTASTSCELGSFYRFCHNAPPLLGFAEEQTLEQQFGGDLTKQLESFEASLRDYDALIDSLRKSK